MAAAAITVLLLAGCTSPSRTDDDYARKAVHTAETVTSAVQSARLVTKVAAAGKATGPYVDVMLTESETTVGETQTTFEGVQPPSPQSGQLRDQLSVLLGQATDVLATLRIEARRGNLARLGQLGAALDPLTEQLTEFAQAHQQ